MSIDYLIVASIILIVLVGAIGYLANKKKEYIEKHPIVKILIINYLAIVAAGFFWFVYNSSDMQVKLDKVNQETYKQCINSPYPYKCN